MLNRRDFIQASALAGSGLLLSRVARSQEASATPALVSLPTGKLAGEAHAGVNVFHGVPFAQPPVGRLRFRPPQPLGRWTGVRDATKFAPAAIQPGESPVGQSEDCLYLNVWAPAGAAPSSCPVFVWVHGGGFTGGRSSDPLSDGTRFAHEGVIVVTVAYRLGIFGFLDLEPALGPSYAGSANNGLRDLMAALAWVKTNIAAFGGDPSRVTVGGESAGAKLTGLLMGVPTAKELFHQAISESGGAERVWPRERALEVGKSFANAWTAKTTSPASSILDAPSDQLLQAQEAFMHDSPVHFPLRCELEPGFLPQLPDISVRGGLASGKRLLLGTNRDESAFFIGPNPGHDPGAHDLGNMSVEQFRPIEEAYAKQFPDLSPAMRRIRSVTAEEYLIPSLRLLDAFVAAGGEAFAYRLDFGGEQGRFAHLAFHSYDLRFVWDHFGRGETPSPNAQALAAALHGAWLAFLQGKPPAGPGLPQWPRYTLATRDTMILDEPSSHVEQDPEKAELAIWQGLLP